MDAGASEVRDHTAPAFSLADPVEAALGTMAMYGPRAVTPDMPLAAVQEIARSPQFAVLKEASLKLSRMRAEVERKRCIAIGQHLQRKKFKASEGLGGTLHMRVEPDHFERMRVKFRGTETWSDRGAAWADQEYIEWYREKFPYCQVKTTHGTRGQEYAGRNKS
jgi:hypothetical protein